MLETIKQRVLRVCRMNTKARREGAEPAMKAGNGLVIGALFKLIEKAQYHHGFSILQLIAVGAVLVTENPEWAEELLEELNKK